MCGDCNHRIARAHLEKKWNIKCLHSYIYMHVVQRDSVFTVDTRTWEKAKSKFFTFLHIHTYYTERWYVYRVYSAISESLIAVKNPKGICDMRVEVPEAAPIAIQVIRSHDAFQSVSLLHVQFAYLSTHRDALEKPHKPVWVLCVWCLSCVVIVMCVCVCVCVQLVCVHCCVCVWERVYMLEYNTCTAGGEISPVSPHEKHQRFSYPCIH